MFSIKNIDHIVLRTNNMEQMTNFYCNILLCKIEKIHESIGLTQIRAGSSIIDLLQCNEVLDKNQKNLHHFCLIIDNFNFDNLKNYFATHKIDVYNYAKRYGATGYGFSFFINDPDQNSIELKDSMAI